MSADQTHNRRKFLAGARPGRRRSAAAAAANAQEAGHSHHGNSGIHAGAPCRRQLDGRDGRGAPRVRRLFNRLRWHCRNEFCV